MKSTGQSNKELEQELRDVAKDDEVLSLLRLGERLSKVSQPQRSAATHQAGWRNISAATSTAARPWYRLNWKFALVPAGAFAGLVAIVFVAQGALPGDPTYSVKRATESVQLAVALSDSRKAGLCSVQMKLRANELARLPADRLSDDTVSSLTEAILVEAKEYQEYAQKSGENADALGKQRNRDAEYVIDALTTALKKTSSERQTKTINDTIAAMQQIISAS